MFHFFTKISRTKLLYKLDFMFKGNKPLAVEYKKIIATFQANITEICDIFSDTLFTSKIVSEHCVYTPLACESIDTFIVPHAEFAPYDTILA